MRTDYHTIIFDFDGTIANTLKGFRLVLNSMADDYGYAPIEEEQINELRKLDVNEFIEYLGISKFTATLMLAKGLARMKSHMSDVEINVGMQQILMGLKQRGRRAVLLTSNSEENVALFIEKYGLEDCFAEVKCTSKLFGKSKHLKKMKEKYNDGAVLYIGDEVRDIVSCGKAEVDIAAVSWGFNAKEKLEAAAPQYLFEHADELAAFLKSE